MVESIDNALATEFSDMVHKVAQQGTSRLKPLVQIKQLSADNFAYDGLGRVEARKANGRNLPATFDDIDHFRRKISRDRYIINLPIDASDVRGALMDPQSNYAEEVAKGMLREYDRVLCEAAFADVLTGRDFDTTVTAANDGVATIDATAGLTYEKLLEIRQGFWDDEVGLDASEQLFLTVTGAENTALMGEVELTSGDYTHEYVVEDGVVTKALGMQIVPFAASVPHPILAVSGGVRSLLAASTRGLCLGISSEMSIKIQERNDMVETTQVQIIADIGAVRTEGVLVKKVTTTA